MKAINSAESLLANIYFLNTPKTNKKKRKKEGHSLTVSVSHDHFKTSKQKSQVNKFLWL